MDNIRKWHQSTYKHIIQFTNVDRLCPSICNYIYWPDSLPIYTLLKYPYRFISKHLRQTILNNLPPLRLLLLCDRNCALAHCLPGTWNLDWNLLRLWYFWLRFQRFESLEQSSVLMLHYLTSSHFLWKLLLSRED